MAIDDTTFELTRVSNCRQYKEERVTHVDLDAEFLAVVDVDPATICEVDVLNAVDCPRAYQTFANTAGIPGIFGAFLLCTEASVERIPERSDHFKVKCKFTSNYMEDTDRNQSGYDPDDPTTWTSVAKIQRQKFNKVLGLSGKDLDNKIFATSAGQRFSDLPEVPANIICFRAYQYLPANTTMAEIEKRNNTINDDTWNGFAENTVKVEIVEDEFGRFGTSTYCRRLLIEFQYNPDTWLERRLDIGTAYLTDSGGAVGDPANWTFFPNGEEGYLVDGEPSPNAPAELTFRFLAREDFSTLFKVVFIQ